MIGADSHDDWLGVKRELQLCWLAHALHETAARFFLRQQQRSGWWLLGLGGHEADALDTVLRRQHDQQAAAVHLAGYAALSDAQHAAQWLHRQQIKPQLVVVFASAALTSDALQQLTESAEETHAALVVVTGPIALLVEVPDRVRCIESLAGSSARRWSFILRPLTRLWTQCGWRFAIEMMEQSKPGQHDSKSSLFVSSVARMPFQMLLLVLRWSYFHPRVLGLLGKAFERKLQLIPQQRHRDAIRWLLQRNAALWPQQALSDRELLEALPSSAVAAHSVAAAAPLVFTYREEHDARQRLSKCRLWDVQKQFYVEHGIRAWSDSLIPFGVSSSSFLAAAYARTYPVVVSLSGALLTFSSECDRGRGGFLPGRTPRALWIKSCQRQSP